MDFTEDELFGAFGVEQTKEPEGPEHQAPPEGQEEEVPITEPETPPQADGPAEIEVAPEAPAGSEIQGDGHSPAARANDGPGDLPVAIDRAVRQALEAERARQQGQMAQFFRDAGLRNTVTGKPITSMEEFETWKQEFAAVRLERELQEGKLSREGLDAAIESNPAVRQARELARQQQEEQRQRADAEAQARINAEIAEIGKLDGSIKSVEDLLKMPNARAFYAYVRRGNTFLDAYYLANREALAQKAAEESSRQAAETARQQALLSARSKDHLTPAKAQGQGALSVPKGDMELFKALLPEAGETEFQNYYNQYRKGGNQA